MQLLYKNEQPLFFMLLVIATLIWGGLLVGTQGMVLGYVVSFFVFYLIAQSAFISYLKGTAVEITPAQFPDLHERIVACCQKLEFQEIPHAYLLHADGAFNALATRFLGRNFIVLFSDIVDALEEHPDALNFYIGHEIGHIKRNHLRWNPVLMPAAMLPLIGAAYSRAREYTCDRHGLAACDDATSAQLGLGALAAGGKRWRTLNSDRYVAQSLDSSGFWMSLHELLSDYPWLTKRVAAMQSLANGADGAYPPRRHPLAWVLALFIPRLGMGGGAASGLVMVAMIGILAAIAIPAYQEYTVRAQLVGVVATGRQAAAAVGNYYQVNGRIPKTLEQAGFVSPPSAVGVQSIGIDSNSGTVQVRVAMAPHTGKSIFLVPSLDANKRVVWSCGSKEIGAALLPPDCRS